MSSVLLNCYNCGAPAPADARECAHCSSALASISCPDCLGLMFKGTKFCPHCGAGARRAESGPSGSPCPGCNAELNRTTVGSYSLSECGSCHGVWAEAETLAAISAQAEKGTLPEGSTLTPASPISSPEDKVRYKKCPECRELMNRTNFAKCSGIIVDSCRNHGSWFEQGELQRIVRYVQQGGLSVSREREKQQIIYARQQLELTRSLSTLEHLRPKGSSPDPEGGLVVGLLGALFQAALASMDRRNK